MERLLNKYRILEQIGSGGMADVFLAEMDMGEGLKKMVALKILHPHVAKSYDLEIFFKREIYLSTILRHKNIVQTFEYGFDGDTPYICMEYIHGMDLLRLIIESRRIPQELAIFITKEILEGLHYAHNLKDQDGKELGIVHRDVSPQNIMVSFQGEVKILDFGLARLAKDGLRKSQSGIKGKFLYMAPEQMEDEDIDHRCDLYGAGCILYEMLTGVPPFSQQNIIELATAKKNGVIKRPCEIVPEIHPSLEEVIFKVLSPDKNTRYKSAKQMYEALCNVERAIEKSATCFDLIEFIKKYKPSSRIPVKTAIVPKREKGSKKMPLILLLLLLITIITLFILWRKEVSNKIIHPSIMTSTGESRHIIQKQNINKDIEIRETENKKNIKINKVSSNNGVRHPVKKSKKIPEQISLKMRQQKSQKKINVTLKKDKFKVPNILIPKALSAGCGIKLDGLPLLRPKSISLKDPILVELLCPRSLGYVRLRFAEKSHRIVMSALAKPWATVFIGNNKVGDTPLGRVFLKRGMNRIEFSFENKRKAFLIIDVKNQ